MDNVEVARVDSYSDDRFDKNILKQHNAFLVNGKIAYEIEIVNKTDAIIKGNPEYYDIVIEEFRFFCGHITNFFDINGNIISKFESVSLFEIDIEKIQPSQFFVDNSKKKSVESFIKSKEDVIIPLMKLDSTYIAMDGHTRISVAIDKGFKSVYGYIANPQDYILDFVKEAQKRNIYSPYDLVEIDHDEYEIKWNNYCDKFWENM